MKSSFTRRNFLRAGGIAIALPSLESFAKHPNSSKKPVKRMICLSNNYGVYQKAFFPTQG